MSPINKTYVDLGDGVKREVKFTMKACQAIKQKTGKSVFRGDVWQDVDEDVLPVVLAAVLVDKSISADDIASQVNMRDIPRIVEELLKAYIEVAPETDSEKN